MRRRDYSKMTDEEYQRFLDNHRPLRPVYVPERHPSTATFVDHDSNGALIAVERLHHFTWDEWAKPSIKAMEESMIDVLPLEAKKRIWDTEGSCSVIHI